MTRSQDHPMILRSRPTKPCDGPRMNRR